MMSKTVQRIRTVLLTLFIVGLLIALYWALHFYRYVHQTPLRIESAGYLVMVPPGTSVNKIADSLAEAGIMDHPQWFLWWMQVTGSRSQVKAGEYLIRPGLTPQGLIDLLVTGKVVQHAITIVEGWTFDRLMQAVNEAPKLTHTLQGLSNQEIMAKLGRVGEHPEGQFFPDTYYFPANTTDLAFLQRAYRVMQEKLNQAWENRERTLALKSPYEALILASIIEKESCYAEEYNEIAGVYVRRLARNMPLQADPTVIYGLGKNFGGQLTLAHLRQPSNYNTYLNVGLPPTPIALPSQRALEAATRPKPGETLFFVATGTDRRHVFSKTEEEHQKAVLRYRAVKAQIEKERSLAVQETEVIAQEEEMVAQKKEKQAKSEKQTKSENQTKSEKQAKSENQTKSEKQAKSEKQTKRTPEERKAAKNVLQQAKETLAETAEAVPVTLPTAENNAQSAEGSTGAEGTKAKKDTEEKTKKNNKKDKKSKNDKKKDKVKKTKKDKKNKGKAEKTDKKIDKVKNSKETKKSKKAKEDKKKDKKDQTDKKEAVKPKDQTDKKEAVKPKDKKDTKEIVKLNDKKKTPKNQPKKSTKET